MCKIYSYFLSMRHGLFALILKLSQKWKSGQMFSDIFYKVICTFFVKLRQGKGGGERRVAILKLFHQDKLFAKFILHRSLSTIIYCMCYVILRMFPNFMKIPVSPGTCSRCIYQIQFEFGIFLRIYIKRQLFINNKS